MPLRALRSQDLEALLTPAVAFTACERAFRAVAAHTWHPAQYEALELGGTRLTSSLSYDDGGTAIRFERASAGATRASAAEPGVVGIHRPAGTLVAVLPWAPLERMRASASAALATRLLANERAPCLAVIGTGTQARLHIQAITRVRNVKRVLTVGRTEAKSQAFAIKMAAEFGGGMAFEPADIGRAASLADILCLCTNSRTPVLFGNEVRRGCHINAVGALAMDAREADTNTVLRSKVAIEDKEMGLGSAGELRMPVNEGAVAADSFQTDLGDLLTGKKILRTAADDITLFKAVGHPAVDFYLALAAYELALERRIGQEVEF